MMERHEIERILKEYLGIQKPLVVLKPLKEIPHSIPHYEGTAYPGQCTQIGEILKSPATFYVTRENNACYEGLIATGVCQLSREEYREALGQFMETCRYHKDMDTAMAFYEENIKTIPVPPLEHACLVAGPFADVEDPDLEIFFCTLLQADILLRAQDYIGNLNSRYLQELCHLR